MSKFNRAISALFAGVLTVGTLGLAACGGGNGGGGNGGGNNNADTIYVKMYNGGFGTAWLSKAGEEYTAKTGTKISIKTFKSESMGPQNVKTDSAELFFLQDSHYYNFVEAGVLADISEAVTGANPYETGKTIEDKLSEDQKSFLTVKDGKYYALPHYVGNWGIVYDMQLFDDSNYYFAEGQDKNDEWQDVDDRAIRAKFVKAKTDKKANGPDGVYGTDDDGLPATYDEFFKLCKVFAK